MSASDLIAEYSLYLDGLFVANERNNTETQRLACVILSVFGLLHHGREQ